MFIYDIKSNFSPGLLLGFYINDEKFTNAIKDFLNKEYPNKINYKDITNEMGGRNDIQDNNCHKLGLLSYDWIKKYNHDIPGLIVQMLDITCFTPQETNKMLESISSEIITIHNNFHLSHQLLIIKNIHKIFENEKYIKNQITKIQAVHIKDKSVFFFNDDDYCNNHELIKNISMLIIEQIQNYYSSKIRNYTNKYKEKESNQIFKNALYLSQKIFSLSTLTNLDKFDNGNNSFFVIQRISLLIAKELNNIIITTDRSEIKRTFLELRNISDFFIYNIISQFEMDENIREINLHLFQFDFIRFYKEKKKDNNNDIFQSEKKMYLNNLIWKQSWYNFFLEKFKDINFDNIKYISLKRFIVNNLLHIYSFVKKENKFIQELINQYINNKDNNIKINSIYLGGLPDFSEKKNGIISINNLPDETSLELFLSDIIFQNKEIFEIKTLLNNLKHFMIDSKQTYYDYYTIFKFCLNNEESNIITNDIIIIFII